MKFIFRYLLAPVAALLLIGVGAVFAVSHYLTPTIEPKPLPPESGEVEIAKATFAGGCFWCMEPPFDKLEGVYATVSGYTGGEKVDPTYEEVCSGTTGHTEALQVTYDPSQVSYEELVAVFWKNIDPTQSNGQFCDHGDQYRAGIFYHDEEQKKIAEASQKEIAKKLGETLHTEVTKFDVFYDAEDYHQDYYIKNPLKYRYYRYGCGRDAQLERIWGEAAAKEDSPEKE